MSLIAPTLQAFFTERLTRQRQASPRTVAAYRDTFRLLMNYLQQHTGKSPSTLDFADLDASTLSAFLDHLEKTTAATVPAPATPDSPRYGRCSVTPPCVTLSTPRSSSIATACSIDVGRRKSIDRGIRPNLSARGC